MPQMIEGTGDAGQVAGFIVNNRDHYRNSRLANHSRNCEMAQGGRPRAGPEVVAARTVQNETESCTIRCVRKPHLEKEVQFYWTFFRGIVDASKIARTAERSLRLS